MIDFSYPYSHRCLFYGEYRLGLGPKDHGLSFGDTFSNHDDHHAMFYYLTWELKEDSSSTSTSSTTVVKRHNFSSLSVGFIFGNNTGYKFWILSSLLLLAFWSMFAGSVTLKWYSSTSLTATTFLDDVQFHTYDEIDILELGKREKVVRRMWEVYIERHNNKGIRLLKFWLHAFEVAFEYLVRDVAEV
ncbi:hypothetical protein ACFE04_027735 [Oxalis oulophora]